MRQLAAIMFTDIVGYSALMSKDDIKNKPGMKAECFGKKALKNIDLPVKIYSIAIECFHPSSQLFTDPDEFRSDKKETVPVSVSPDRATSVAVIPFTDLSPERDQEYFCEGMAEEIINALTQLDDLHVAARTSVFSFKGKNLDIREIGMSAMNPGAMNF